MEEPASREEEFENAGISGREVYKGDTISPCIFVIIFEFFLWWEECNCLCVTCKHLYIHSFFQGELLYLLPIVFVGNDALGTVVAGKISFIWLTAVLIIAEKLRKRKAESQFLDLAC